MKVKLYNEEIAIRTHYCQLNDCPASHVEEPYINLYVKFSGCNAKCPFCIDDCKKKAFDLDKLKEVVQETSRHLKIRKVSFTGGEPTLDIGLLEHAFDIVKHNSADAFTVINTNGFNLKGIFDSEVLREVDSVSLSRHHYFDHYNGNLFGAGVQVATNPKIWEVTIDKEKARKIHFSCNLIRGYIDNMAEVRKYLDAANGLGVHDVGFL